MKQAHLEYIIKLRHQLHSWPELSLKEEQTKAMLMEFLKAHTALQIVDQGNWFYAVYHSPKCRRKPIAFRADFDALPISEELAIPYASKNPGVSHKCGHDGHSAVLAGLALEINASGADRDVYFIFQHGEEIGAGGKECARLIAARQIARIFAFHNCSGYPEGSIMVRDGIAHCASKGLTIGLAGSPAHASEPENGKNPAPAIARLALYLEALKENLEHRGLVMTTIVQITAGKKDFGIAAASGELSVTLRAHYEQDLDRLEAALRQYAEELAGKEGLLLFFEEHDPFPETINDSESAELVRQAARKTGRELITMAKPFRASEDFGYYLKECPGAMFFIGNGTDYPKLHTLEYDFNDRILEAGVELFKTLVTMA